MLKLVPIKTIIPSTLITTVRGENLWWKLYQLPNSYKELHGYTSNAQFWFIYTMGAYIDLLHLLPSVLWYHVPYPNEAQLYGEPSWFLGVLHLQQLILHHPPCKRILSCVYKPWTFTENNESLSTISHRTQTGRLKIVHWASSGFSTNGYLCPITPQQPIVPDISRC